MFQFEKKTHRDCMHAVGFLCILEGRYTVLSANGSHTWHWLRTWSPNRHQHKCPGDRPHCRHSHCLSSIQVWVPLKHAKVTFKDMLMPTMLLWKRETWIDGILSNLLVSLFHTRLSLRLYQLYTVHLVQLPICQGIHRQQIDLGESQLPHRFDWANMGC